MKINTISLKNFRNYNQCEVPLNSRINLFLGANGQGKTSLLEAIWFSINGKSYRTSNAKNIISFSKKHLAALHYQPLREADCAYKLRIIIILSWLVLT